MTSLSLANQSLLVDQVKLAYYKSNVEHNTTIVLLHGYCGSSSYYHKLVPLIEEFASVIVFDLFGHGQSNALQFEAYSLEHIAVLLNRALEQLNINKYYLFGHSLGGYITLAYAKQYINKLSGFGLIHSTALEDSETAKANRLNVVEAVKKQGVEPFAMQLAGKLFGKQPLEADVALARAIGVQTAEQAVIGFAHGMRERKDAQEVISHAQVPVLLIAGAQDKIVTPEAVFAGHNEKTVCEIIEQAGHMGMLECEHEIASRLKRFIGS